MRTLPEAAPRPVLRPQTGVTGDRLAEIGRRLAEAKERVALARDGLAAAEGEMAALLATTGGRCPACGTPAAPASLLAGHRHARPEEAA
uniref:hypothetical protein n=1 Tax=Methylobacterium terrae TaxID=2202827 RepID=UPI001FE22D6D|nr:hypothetical protein [Methylobacterium terrae]